MNRRDFYKTAACGLAAVFAFHKPKAKKKWHSIVHDGKKLYVDGKEVEHKFNGNFLWIKGELEA